MFANPAHIALLKIALTFVVMLLVIRRNRGLWVAILSGGLVLAFSFGMTPLAVASTIVHVFPQPSFITLFLVVAFIMLLSEVQGASGQGQRLVNGLTPYMKSPRLRLIFFPALVGLLPMPGGAIFSCPMVRDVAEHFDVSDRKKVLINYWFRHIWESAWPLYPGYVLTCALGNIPPSLLWRYTFPFVLTSLALGWLFLLRTPIKPLAGHVPQVMEKRPLFHVLLEGLPIIIAIGGALAVDSIFSMAGVPLPGGTAFVLSFSAAALTSIIQNRMTPAQVLRLVLQKHVFRMLAVIVMIFIFKEIVIQAKVVDALATIIEGRSAMLALFLFLPIMMGALTGLMMGFVGASFPLLMGLLHQAGLYDERLCWIMVSLAAGHFGQMVSPLHSCYLVTVEFFRISFSATWITVVSACLVQLSLACAYTGALYFLVRPLL